MKTRNAAGIRTLLVLGDVAVTLAMFGLAGRLRFGPGWIATWEALVPRPALFFLAYGLTAVATFAVSGLYETVSRWSLGAELRAVGRGVAGLVLVTFALLYMFKLDQVSRLFLLWFFVLETAGGAAVRAAAHGALVRFRRRGRARRRLVVVGTGDDAVAFAAGLAADPGQGVSVVGFVGPESPSIPAALYLGKRDELAAILAGNVVDEVVLFRTDLGWEEIESLVAVCEEQGKRIRIPLSFMDHVMAHGELERMAGTPVLTLARTPERSVELAAKRAVDLAGAALLLLAVSPLLAVAAAAIVVSDGRPVFFTQERVGLHGRRFRIVKLRTMVPDAEARLAEVGHLNEREGPVFKVSADPRITPVGRILRRTSIDELPQLWNVVRGDMSLVGPRPPIPSEVDRYDPWHRRRLSMKPGITGLWQVSARQDPSFERWVEMDLDYIDRWSLGLDLTILARTVPAVLSLTGR